MAQPSLDITDVVVVGAMLILGALQVYFVARAADFLHDDDAFYFDAARSLVRQHFYGVAGRPETNMPPGLSGIVAVLCLAGACSHMAIMRAMAVFQTLGFLASYAFLRRVAPRAVAAATCLLLASAPVYFALATQSLFSYFPYFFTSICALLVAQQLEITEKRSKQIAWAALLAILCAASVIVNTAGIALAGALIVRGIWLRLRDGRAGAARMTLFVLVALVGLGTQGLWMRHRPAPLEWPLPGYPRPYLQQLLVKSGNHPELGMATSRDVALRIVGNANDHAGFLSELVIHHWLDHNWASPAVLIVLALTLLGWITSIVNTGGEVYDWYFAAYEAIYLLWPWALESRFFLPVAPLACLYVWRGAVALLAVARERPRVVGAAWLLVSAVLMLGALSWMRGLAAASANHPGVQSRVSVVFWSISAICALWWLWRRDAAWAPLAPLLRPTLDLPAPPGHRRIVLSTPRLLALTTVAALVLVGLLGQINIARANVDPHSEVNALSPDDQAGVWLRSHTDTAAVVMARHAPTVYHLSGRKVVWFPPSSDPQLLMDGIRRLEVDYVVVVHRSEDYYMPPDDSCFNPVLAAFPDRFSLAFQGPRFSIYRMRRPDAAGDLAAGAHPSSRTQ